MQPGVLRINVYNHLFYVKLYIVLLSWMQFIAAGVFMKMKKPNAAIRDADVALQVWQFFDNKSHCCPYIRP
jgi:hypothetical protein